MEYASVNDKELWEGKECVRVIWGDQKIATAIAEEEKQKENERISKRIENERIEKERQRILLLKREERINLYKNKYGDYWKYEDIYVPLSIRSIPSIDKINRITLCIDDEGEPSIISTLLGGPKENEYTLDDYHAKFCTMKYEDGENRYYYTYREQEEQEDDMIVNGYLIRGKGKYLF